MNFVGRTVCVTGASQGIGRAICEALSVSKADAIVAVSRTKGDLPDRIGTTLINFVAGDLSRAEEAERLSCIIANEHGDCSVLINNAGSQLLADCVAPDAGENSSGLESEIQLNFVTPIMLGLHLMPVLLRHDEAAICNISSGLALAPKQSAPVYCATKAGLSCYTRALRYQASLRAGNLRVFEALPPLVDTEMTRGRGRGKLTPADCARQIVAGMERDRAVIDIGKTGVLRAIMRIAPSLGYRMMRNG